MFKIIKKSQSNNFPFTPSLLLTFVRKCIDHNQFFFNVYCYTFSHHQQINIIYSPIHNSLPLSSVFIHWIMAGITELTVHYTYSVILNTLPETGIRGSYWVYTGLMGVAYGELPAGSCTVLRIMLYMVRFYFRYCTESDHPS